jgi:hypothetical protein
VTGPSALPRARKPLTIDGVYQREAVRVWRVACEGTRV